MNRNTESHFAANPVNIDMQRSIFTATPQHKTTFNTGDLIPVYWQEILPGDTFSVDMSMAVRMATPIFPIMDNLNMDIYWFFVPNRLVWEHWREFMGENRTTAWEQETEYEIPQIEAPASTGWTKGTIADYMGVPTGIADLSISALPFRAYCMIWNEWFRDENLKDPANISLDETTQTGTNSGDYVLNAQLGALPLKVAKYHDYFTSALPAPQKGEDTSIPLPFPELSGTFPVYGNGKTLNLTDGTNVFGVYGGRPNFSQLLAAGTGYANKEIGQNTSEGTSPGSGANHEALGVVLNGESGMKVDVSFEDENAVGGSISINQLRQSFAIQRMLEKDARGGTRYTEIIRSHFGVISPDARQQRPEYLGGCRVPINIDQVLQTSQTATTPQGNTAAYSLTNMAGSMFTKSFTEHGFLMGLIAVRTEHTYQQGLARAWSRKTRLDYYWPSLANIGEQAILNKEIYCQGPAVVDADGNAIDDQAFGYQEAFADYRYIPDRVSGQFRSNLLDSLDAWHLADAYESLPQLSSDWIDETDVNVERVIATEDEDQFIGDFAFQLTMSRPMPMYSIPGLLDHH